MLTIYLIITLAIVIYDLIKTKKQNKILKNNFMTALKIINDPVLTEKIENGEIRI